MYSLMIVDDELIVQRAISHLIETYCPAIRIVGKTSSGMEAVTLALQEKPDIILMDIELTGLNGLEALCEIKQKLPETVAIIISAYDNFQYAKQSISLGVMDYLLKPVSKDDLINVLTKAVNQLETERGRTREKLELREKLSKVKPFLEEDLFLSLLYPGIGTHSCDDYQNFLELKVTLGQAIEVYGTDHALFINKLERFRQMVRNRLSEASVLLFSPIIGRTLLLLVGYETAPADPKRVWVDLQRQFAESLGLPTTIVLGAIAEGFEGMIRSLRELRGSARFYNCQPGVYEYRQLQSTETEGSSVLYAKEQEFFEMVKAGREELARLAFNELLQISEATFKDDWQSLKDYFQGIIAVLRQIFFEIAPDQSKQVWERNYSLKRINDILDRNEITVIIDEILSDFTRSNTSRSFPEKNPEIRAVVEFLEANYQSDLTLADIAAAVALSPGYLAKLFKEYQNQTVMDFLERVRIDRALKLLKETTYPIKEIASLVGYKDPNYFSKVFKKVTNSSPTEIRG